MSSSRGRGSDTLEGAQIMNKCCSGCVFAPRSFRRSVSGWVHRDLKPENVGLIKAASGEMQVMELHAVASGEVVQLHAAASGEVAHLHVSQFGCSLLIPLTPHAPHPSSCPSPLLMPHTLHAVILRRAVIS